MSETTTETTTTSDDAAEGTRKAPPKAPKVGDLIRNEAGTVGLVVGPGRTPDKAKNESAEPEILWLAGEAAPYGGAITAL